MAVPGIGAVFVVVFLLMPAGTAGQSLVYDALGTVTVGIACISLRRRRPGGALPWILLVAGQTSFVVGDIIWTAFQALGQDPFPSTADGAYLLGYPLMAVGLLVAIRRRITGGDRAGLLDAAILTTGTSVAWWAFVLGPQAAFADPEPVAFIISLAYPIGDLLLIGMALGLAMTPGARSLSFRLLMLNLAILLVGDLAFGLQSMQGTYVDGSWVDIIWMVGYVSFAAAISHPSMESVFEPRPVAVTMLSPIRLLLLGLAMLVGPAILTIGHTDADAIVFVVAGASATVSVLVLARLAGMVRLLGQDIERRKSLEELLSFQAFHDPLTGLANRRRFMARVAEALSGGSGAATLFVDLDDFKHINDNLGHDAGDALLAAVGRRIAASIRPTDLASRLGGDEFAVLLLATESAEEAALVAERLLETLSAPVEIAGRLVRITASIGVARCEPSETIGVDGLLRRADVAMYHAKALGKHRAAVYRPDLLPAPATVRKGVSGDNPPDGRPVLGGLSAGGRELPAV